MQGTDNFEKRKRVSCRVISAEQGLKFELDDQGCASKGLASREPITGSKG